jgi:hypothetical protein
MTRPLKTEIHFKRHAKRIRLSNGYYVHAVWFRAPRGTKAVAQISLIIQRAPNGRPLTLRPGAGLPAWLTRAQAKRLQAALAEALR